MNDSRISDAIYALVNEDEIIVNTKTRRFRGRIWEIYRSPYGSHLGARVVDDEGRVHHFKINAPDTHIVTL